MVEPMNFVLRVDPQFRREQFLEGVEVQPEHELDIPAYVIAQEDREYILNTIIPADRYGLPTALNMTVPTVHEGEVLDEFWMAKLNPDAMLPEQLIATWVAAYKVAQKQIGR